MATKDNGGPAFPYEHGHSPDAANVRESGMNLRDWFAGQALVGLLAFSPVNTGPDGQMEPKKAAEKAYQMADALLTARAEPK